MSDEWHDLLKLAAKCGTVNGMPGEIAAKACAEIDRLTAWKAEAADTLVAAGKSLANVVDENERLEADNARLREALNRFATHNDDCGFPGAKCHCGLGAALEVAPSGTEVRAGRYCQWAKGACEHPDCFDSCKYLTGTQGQGACAACRYHEGASGHESGVCRACTENPIGSRQGQGEKP